MNNTKDLFYTNRLTLGNTAPLIIRLSLLLLLSAFALLLTADMLSYLHLPVFPALMTQLSLPVLFCAFGLLLVTGLVFLGRRTLQAIAAYFSATERHTRRLLFTESQRLRTKHAFYFRSQQIKSLSELKRRQLLRRNNKKHALALSKAIDADLRRLKQTLPKAAYQTLQQENKRYRNQLDSAALVALQQKIAAID